jgi:hypothetical protein
VLEAATLGAGHSRTSRRAALDSLTLTLPLAPTPTLTRWASSVRKRRGSSTSGRRGSTVRAATLTLFLSPPLRGLSPPLRGLSPPLRGLSPPLRGLSPPLRGLSPPLWSPSTPTLTLPTTPGSRCIAGSANEGKAADLTAEQESHSKYSHHSLDTVSIATVRPRTSPQSRRGYTYCTCTCTCTCTYHGEGLLARVYLLCLCLLWYYSL